MTHPWEIKPDDVVLTELIGEGSFADVYMGTYRGKPVAIKKLKIPSMVTSAKERFIKEVNAMYNLRHENVAMLIGACISPKRNYILMELLPYCLRDLVGCAEPKKHGREEYTWRDKLKILYDVGLTIKYLHVKKILHRDIKGGNIVMDKTMMIPKLIDFGLAQTYSTTVATTVQSNVAEGTVNWMSPESMIGKYSVAGEIWSFGCLCYEVFTGLTPFAKQFPMGGTPLREFLKDATSDFSCLKVEGEKFAPLNKIIRSCVQAKREDRMSLTDVLVMINTLLDAKFSWLDEPSLPESWEPTADEFDVTTQKFSTLSLRTGTQTRTTQVQGFLAKHPQIELMDSALETTLDSNKEIEQHILERKRELETMNATLQEKEKEKQKVLEEVKRIQEQETRRKQEEIKEAERKRLEAIKEKEAALKEKERLELEAKKRREEQERAEREHQAEMERVRQARERAEQEERRAAERAQEQQRELERAREQQRAMERQHEMLRQRERAEQALFASLLGSSSDFSRPSSIWESSSSYASPSYSRPSAPQVNRFNGQSTGQFWSSNGRANGSEIFRGSRGGEYYINSNGNRTYIKRS